MIYKEGAACLSISSTEVKLTDRAQCESIQRSLLSEYGKIKAQGLAAPQIGVNKRVFIVRIKGNPVVMFNPKVKFQFGNALSRKEGCESVNGRFDVIRPRLALISYHSSDGKKHTKLYGFKLSRIFCHELDHLNGKLISNVGRRVSV